MLISPGSTCFVSSSNIDQGGGGGRVEAKRELIFHTSDRSLVQKQSFLNNFVQDCRLKLKQIHATWLAEMSQHNFFSSVQGGGGGRFMS